MRRTRSSLWNRTDYTIAVTLDNKPIDSRLVYPFYQSDPFPGGHHYTIEISGPGLQKLFERVTLGFHERPDMFLSQDVFNALELFLYSYCDEDVMSKVRYKYFLNSIEKLSLESARLNLIGECSEVVR